MTKISKIRNTTLAILSGLVVTIASSSANALTVKLDGIADGSDPAYVTSKSVLWFNDHKFSKFPSGGSPLQTTTVKYGTGTKDGGDATQYFFVYVEAPVSNKGLVWGDKVSIDEIAKYNQQYTTHHDDLSNDPTSKEYFDFEKAFGSEKLMFNGIVGDPDVEKSDNTFKGDKFSGTGLVDAVSSVTWALANGCDIDGCGKTSVAFSFEFMFELSAMANLVSFFDNPNSEIITHLSPERGGSLSVVPLPAALPLYGAGLAVMGFIGWRKKKAAATV
ncbi:hypothetical protein A9Q83_05935 [Alphaproteobacteria bacterium 46_93_T64]|nr:hypothetical protein A9Q83_05935 [Alphaproteobacteria bacterium 46_93_T64]